MKTSKILNWDALYEEYMKIINSRSTKAAPLVDDYNNLSKEEYERQKEEMIKSSKLYEKKERW